MKKTRDGRYMFRRLSWVVMLCLLFAACAPTPAGPQTDEAEGTPEALPTAAPLTAPTESLADSPSAEPSAGQKADPQRVEFQAEDGKNLVGYYYPSRHADAPVVILMHWAGGDLTDWCEIALWLQNRRDENPVQPERCANAGMQVPWLDPSWFPPMNENVSFAVFAFDFRDFGESGTGGGADWQLDAKASFVAAAGLEGVDKMQMATMGASIGADGAPDGCLLYNKEAGGGCIGALSLSPGDYLDLTYAPVVSDLAPVPVWCLAAEGDRLSAMTCNSASGEQYRSQIYAGNPHGMLLITPNLEPQPMLLIQDFLELVFGQEVK